MENKRLEVWIIMIIIIKIKISDKHNYNYNIFYFVPSTLLALYPKMYFPKDELALSPVAPACSALLCSDAESHCSTARSLARCPLHVRAE